MKWALSELVFKSGPELGFFVGGGQDSFFCPFVSHRPPQYFCNTTLSSIFRSKYNCPKTLTHVVHKINVKKQTFVCFLT